MKATLITTIAVATLLIAGAAVAQDFHPILDADYLGGMETDETVAGQLDLNNPGPHRDSELGGESLTAGSNLAAGSFHNLLDADILGNEGPVCNGETVAAATGSD